MARVLIVDDDDDICHLMANAFKLSGHNADVVHSGQEALDKLQQERYDAMVLDLKMPGVSGEAVLARQEAFSDVPIFVLTGYASIETAARAVRTKNVVDYLQKHEADPMDVVGAVETHLAFYQVGDFALDIRARKAFYQDKPFETGEAQMPLYELFIKHPNGSFSYQDLAKQIDGHDLSIREARESMRVRIHRLRKVLKELAGFEVIRSVAGYGFSWSHQVQKRKS